MKNNFDKYLDRSNNHERRWNKEYIKETYNLDDVSKVLDFSIADLDFATPQPIVDALAKRVEQGTYSYSFTRKKSLDVIKKWYQSNHDLNISLEAIKLVHGTVNAMHQIIQAFTNISESVLIQTPIYAPFYHSISNCERKVVENKLVYDDEQKTYKIDFIDFEQQIKNNKVKLFMFCNPHNPVGIRWEESDIKKLISVCEKYDVLIFSDEVHGDLVLYGKQHNSLLKYIKNNVIVANSPNKLFNLGGLKGSYLICEDEKIREKIDQQYKKNSLTTLNVFFQPALIEGYSNQESLVWVREFKKYIENNYQYLKTQLSIRIPFLICFKMDTSYLVWIRINKDNFDALEFINSLKKNNLVVNTYDDLYGAEKNYFRVNIGCPKKELESLIDRLVSVFEQ